LEPRPSPSRKLRHGKDGGTQGAFRSFSRSQGYRCAEGRLMRGPNNGYHCYT
jgi:hypothetical protein